MAVDQEVGAGDGRGKGRRVNVLDLFSGIGGFSLGLERAGMRTIAFCEIEPYCQRVLGKHWPDVPICQDIRPMEAYRTAEGSGSGFVRARSFAWAHSGTVQRKPSIHVGCLAPSHKNAEQDQSPTTQGTERYSTETAQDAAALSFSRCADFTVTDADSEATRQSLLPLRQSRF